MITPKLEQLIWEGKAFFKTYIAGPQKSTLNIDNDRFIIITDVTYSGYNNNTFQGDLAFPNMQLAIYGEKGFNHYIFRNFNRNETAVYNGTNVELGRLYQTCQPQTLNTYLLHTTQVGFSFMGNQELTNGGTAIFQEINPSYAPPLEYGKEGDVGAIPLLVAASDSTGVMNIQFQNRKDWTGLAGNVSSFQIQYPADLGTLPNGEGINEYCFAVINYVEILGLPDNIEF